MSVVALFLVGLGPPAVRAQDADPLNDPDTAVRLALRDLGYNPASFSPAIQWIRSLAPDLVYITLRDDPEGLLDGNRFRQALRARVNATLGSGRVVDEWRPEQLRVWAERIHNADPATDPVEAALSRRLRWDAALNREIYSTSLQGGLPRVFRPFTEGPANTACREYLDRWARVYPRPFASCLEYLLAETGAGS